MAIRPIISVKYNNNYNNLSFEAKKKNKNHHDTPRSAGFMKSIPLAAIIAMSPMNSAQAQNNQYAPEEKIVLQQEYNDGKEKFLINYISNDGDDTNAEKISLGFVENNQFFRKIDGSLKQCNYKKNHVISVDTLEIKETHHKLNNKNIGTTKTYNVIGKRSILTGAATLAEDPNITVEKSHFSSYDHSKQEIPKDLFDYLLQVTNGSIPSQKRTSTVEY